jgi:hypothetical protein
LGRQRRKRYGLRRLGDHKGAGCFAGVFRIRDLGPYLVATGYTVRIEATLEALSNCKTN